MRTYARITGHYQDEPTRSLDALVDLGSWDGDENDHHIYIYMDGEPITQGQPIGDDGFFVESINEVFTQE